MLVPGRTRKPMWSSFHRMDELEESWTGHIVVGSNKVTNDSLSLNDERPDMPRKSSTNSLKEPMALADLTGPTWFFMIRFL